MRSNLPKGKNISDGRDKDFDLRPDPKKAIEKTKYYFNSFKDEDLRLSVFMECKNAIWQNIYCIQIGVRNELEKL